MHLPKGVKLVEHSGLARLAAWKMDARAVALVVGSTIYLHNVNRQEFMSCDRWVKHELKHVEQYQRLGLIPFLARYLWWSLKFGYYNNPLEKEARAAEDI